MNSLALSSKSSSNASTSSGEPKSNHCSIHSTGFKSTYVCILSSYVYSDLILSPSSSSTCNDTYISLQERVEISEKQKGDIFVSIHVNSSVKPEIEGVETHYYHQESLGLAQAVHEALISNLQPFDRGLFKSKFYVINHTAIPAILCEIGFISNEEEQKLLITEQRKQATAWAIVEGVLNYFGQE